MLFLLHPIAELSWTRWSVHWSTVIGIAALGALYAWAARRYLPPGPTTAQRASFVAGLALLFLSLNGPLHDLSDDYLFTAHMAQHLLLTMAVIPLLIYGTPGGMLRPALRVPAVAAVARRVTTPVAAFAIFNVTLVGWHVPALYNLAMANHDVHIAQHLCFMVAATLMWWPFMSPLPELPRLSYPGQMLYAFLMTLPMSLLGMIITYAPDILYPAYESAPRIIALSPLEDQRLGGLVMWLPGGFIFLAVLSSVFFRWSATQADDAASAQVNG